MNQHHPPFAWPIYAEDERRAVERVLRSGRVNYWTGDEGRAFEREFAAFCDARRAVALSNGTAALEIALRALDIGPGDEVIVAPRTFIASASAIVAVGARPLFADVDPDSQNIAIGAIRAVLTPATRAILAVHLAGWPCAMGAIMALADECGLKVIEDCAQAHGARWRGRPVGALGDVAAWSFCQDKIITTGGEGGMLTTNDETLFERAWAYKDHGKSWRATSDKPPTGQFGFRWRHETFGSNARMTEMQAAIGRIQLTKMAAWHAARRRNAEAILTLCERFPDAVRAPRPPADIDHAWYLCSLFVRPQGLKPGWDRDGILAALNARGIPCRTGVCPELYRERAFSAQRRGTHPPLPVAAQLGETSLTLPVHPGVTEADLAAICTALEEVLTEAAFLTNERKNNSRRVDERSAKRGASSTISVSR